MKPSLHPVMHRAQIRLDKLPLDAVILDDMNHAWQYGGVYWYRAYSNTFVSSWELTQITKGRFAVIHPKEAT